MEAATLMVVGAAAQRWVPMARWSGVLGEHAGVPDAWRGQSVRGLPERATDPVEREVAWAIDRAMAHLPVAPSCLAQAFAGQVMLRRRGTGGVVVIGLRRGAAGGAAAGGAGEAGGGPLAGEPRAGGAWEAHAWLLGADGALTGGPAADGFTATTVFEVPGGLRADAVALGGAEG